MSELPSYMLLLFGVRGLVAPLSPAVCWLSLVFGWLGGMLVSAGVVSGAGLVAGGSGSVGGWVCVF